MENFEVDTWTGSIFLKKVRTFIPPHWKSRSKWGKKKKGGGGTVQKYLWDDISVQFKYVGIHSKILTVLRGAAETCTHFMSHYSVFLTVDASLWGAFVIGLNWDARCLRGGPWVSQHRFASLFPLLADSFHGDRVISGRLNTICGGALLMSSLVLWAGESKAWRKSCRMLLQEVYRSTGIFTTWF